MPSTDSQILIMEKDLRSLQQQLTGLGESAASNGIRIESLTERVAAVQCLVKSVTDKIDELADKASDRLEAIREKQASQDVHIAKLTMQIKTIYGVLGFLALGGSGVAAVFKTLGG